MEKVMASDNDRLDLICWKYYGTLEGRVVEAVLEANPGIALTQTLRAGQAVYLPVISPQPKERSLW